MIVRVRLCLITSTATALRFAERRTRVGASDSLDESTLPDRVFASDDKDAATEEDDSPPATII
jgi:hypothetical protein